MNKTHPTFTQCVALGIIARRCRELGLDFIAIHMTLLPALTPTTTPQELLMRSGLFTPEEVFADVRRRAIAALNDEDLAQEAVIAVWKAIEAGKLTTPIEIARYSTTVFANLRCKSIAGKLTSRRMMPFDDAIEAPTGDYSPHDMSEMDAFSASLVQDLQEGTTVTELAAKHRVSRQTVHTWCRKLAAGKPARRWCQARPEK